MTIGCDEPVESPVAKEVDGDEAVDDTLVTCSQPIDVVEFTIEDSKDPKGVLDNLTTVISPSVLDCSEQHSTIESPDIKQFPLELVHVSPGQSHAVSAASVNAHQPSESMTTAVPTIDVTPPSADSTVGQCTCDSSVVEEPTAAEIEAVEVDGGYGWLVVLGAFMAKLLLTGTIKSFGLLNIAVNETFECTTSQSALIVSLLITVSLLVSPLVNALCERFTCRIVVVLGGLMCAIGFALGAVATSISHLWISIGLMAGLGTSCAVTPGILIATRYFPIRRSLVNGLVLSGDSFGSFALPVLYKYFLDMYGLRGTLLLIGVLCLIVSLTGCLFRPLEQHKRRLYFAQTRRLHRRSQANGHCDHSQKIKCSVISDSVDVPSLNDCQPHHRFCQERQLQHLSSRRNSLVEKASICSVPTMIWIETNAPNMNRARSLSLSPYSCHHAYENSGFQTVAEETLSVAEKKPNLLHPSMENRSMLMSLANRRNTSPMLSTNELEAGAAVKSSGFVRRIRRSFSEVSSTTAPVDSNLSSSPIESPTASTSLVGKLVSMFDIQLLQSRLFCLLILSICFMAISNPYALVQLPLLVVSQGLTNDDAVLMLSIVSAVDLVSRLSLGWLFDRPGFPRHAAFAGCQLVAGVVLLALPLAGGQFAAVLALSGALTVVMGLWLVNLVPVLADYHGLERVVTAYGLVRMFYGLSTLVGPPLLGVLVDNFGDFGVQYYVMGLLCLIAGVISAFMTTFGSGRQHITTTSHNTKNDNANA